MPFHSPILTNWTSGEISPLIGGRVDVSKYFNGAQTLENVIVSQYGGAERRPGTKYVAQVKDTSKKTRLIPFQFSTADTHIIELGDQYMRFYRNQAPIVETAQNITSVTQATPAEVTIASHGYSDGDEVIIDDVVGMTELNGRRFFVANSTTNTFTLQDMNGDDVDSLAYTAYSSGGTAERVYTISTPYLEADLFDIAFIQSADVMYFAHQDYAPTKLERSALTSWSLSTIVFTGGPFQPVNPDSTHTMTPSATTGTITVTSSDSFFTSDMVGGFIRIGGLVSGVQGYVKITGFTSATVVDAEVQQTLDGTGATADWSMGSFSDEFGYPGAVSFYEERLFYASTPTEPQSGWGSVIGEFTNFTEGADDDDSIVFAILDDQVNEIRWLRATRSLAAGTSGGIQNVSSTISGSAATDPITPSNVNVRRQTTYGVRRIRPQIIGNNVYYVQRNGRVVREYSFSFDADSYVALDMTLLSEHITESQLVDMDYQQSPNNVLWCVRTDGEIATMTRQIDQQVIAWSRQILGGAFSGGNAVVESVAVIPSITEQEDEVWVIVKRTIDGRTKRYVEYFTQRDYGSDPEDAFYVDSGLTYDGDEATVISGLEHLEGQTVSILADGAVQPDRAVSDGQITLDEAASVVQVGLAYTTKIKSVRLEGGAARGTSQGKISRIHKAQIRVYKSGSFEYGPDENTLDRPPTRTPSMEMNQPVDLLTSDINVLWNSGYSRESTIFIRQTQPLPLNVLALMGERVVNE